MLILMNIWKIGKNSMNNITWKKKEFDSHLNVEDITNKYYAHTKGVCKDFEIKNLGDYHNLCVQSETFLLANVFERFINVCLETYELNPAKFLSAPGLA